MQTRIEPERERRPSYIDQRRKIYKSDAVGNKMTNDLAKIVRETELSLVAQPSQYATQLELFVSKDEKILSEFLTQERNEKPHYLRNKDWKMLVGKPEMYSRPKRLLEKERCRFPEVEKQLRDSLAKCDNPSKLGLGPEELAVFGNLPAMAYRLMDMKTRFYESVVAYAKQVGAEKETAPIDATRNPQNRDEIYRRTFRTRNQFEWYNNASAQVAAAAISAVYNLMDAARPTIKQAENVPLIGWLVKMRIKVILKPLPPKAVAESFFRDEIDYNAKRAERIYGNHSENSKVTIEVN